MPRAKREPKDQKKKYALPEAGSSLASILLAFLGDGFGRILKLFSGFSGSLRVFCLFEAVSAGFFLFLSTFVFLIVTCGFPKGFRDVRGWFRQNFAVLLAALAVPQGVFCFAWSGLGRFWRCLPGGPQHETLRFPTGFGASWGWTFGFGRISW